MFGFLNLRWVRPMGANPRPRPEHGSYNHYAPRMELPHRLAERRFNTKRDLSWADTE
ncbi:hypothetical protein [Cognatishimia sp. MH4019]|uniref:hypothetical protein n=1 Tax=Cognatishimia sp. MH4019 TaxID=2854030 RepID=UPI001CD280DF|nr:hypothetical protein [Cognatishimia sp. MH4019]